MSDEITTHEEYVIDRAERALLSNAEAYRLVEENIQMRRELAASEAARAALVAAFRKHRTATHEVKPKFCKTCRESDAAIALAEQPAAAIAPGGAAE